MSFLRLEEPYTRKGMEVLPCIIAEIGQILAGEVVGRGSGTDFTVYKSLGHVVQDLASAWAIYRNP